MALSKEMIEQFIETIQKERGIKLSFDEAELIANQTTDFITLLLAEDDSTYVNDYEEHANTATNPY